MRYALNNLQATVAGFKLVTKDNVFKVCDQPHPELMQRVLECCLKGKFESAASEINTIFTEGYNILDIIGTLTKIIQNYDMNAERRLAYLKAATEFKMRILEGNDSHLQLDAFLATL
jgi:replication factor C subunit 2/4